MHLYRLTLNNLRQFKQRTFEFQPGFNLLVGENGAGKTTILRGLLAALANAQQIGRRPRLEDDDIRLHEHQAEVRAVIHSNNNGPLQFRLLKSLWEPAKRSAPRDKSPLVLLYSSNEAICSSMKVKLAKPGSEAERDSFRTSEEFLYAIERSPPQRSAAANGPRFGDSRSVQDFVGRVLHTFSPDMDEFYWSFEPYECSLVAAGEATTSASLDATTNRQARAFAMRKLREEGEKRRRPLDWPDQAKIILHPEALEREHTSTRNRDLPQLRDIWKGMKFSSGVPRI